MEHVAIDLGSKESQICIRNEKNEILKQLRIRTDNLGAYLKTRGRSRVVLETSCEAFAVADLAKDAGHEVVVVPSSLAPMLGVGKRGIKNDVRDAQAISEVSVALPELPSVHIPSSWSRAAKALCTSRELLVAQRSQLTNRTKAFLRTRLGRLTRVTAKTLPQRTRDKLGADLPRHIELVVQQIEHLNEAIAELDNELEAIAAERPECQRLRTVPGVGPVTAVRFVAAIDDPSRFATASQLVSYLGLSPGEDTTGFRIRRTSITKAGPPAVRRALVQAAWCLLRLRPEDAPVVWAQKVAERRGKKIAVVALAAKLARILFAMLRDQRDYNPRHRA